MNEPPYEVLREMYRQEAVLSERLLTRAEAAEARIQFMAQQMQASAYTEKDWFALTARADEAEALRARAEAAEAERDEAREHADQWAAVAADHARVCDERLDRLRAVKALHAPEEWPSGFKSCRECGENSAGEYTTAWPCATFAAAGGAVPPEAGE